MSGRSRELFVRLVAEFAIIFIGVVLAFQFENWRETRVDREREQEALVALSDDFRANARNLEETIEGQRRTVDALRLWLEAAAGAETEVAPDSLGIVFGYAISWYGEELVSGAWDGLTSSGDVGLLRDTELRSRIAEFYGWVDSGFEDHDNEMDLLFALQNLTRDQTGTLIAPGGTPYWSPGGHRGSDPEAVAAILESPSLHGLLAWKAMLARNRLERLEWLEAQADSILSRIAGSGSHDVSVALPSEPSDES